MGFLMGENVFGVRGEETSRDESEDVVIFRLESRAGCLPSFPL